MRSHDQSVHDQFDSKADAYLHSPVHAEGPDLRRAQELVAGQASRQNQVAPPAQAPVTAPGLQALDVGCGGGHLSFALAPVVERMVALDPSQRMLTTVAKAAAARGLTQIETRHAGAESLPFGDSSFDVVATRFSAHHWGRLEAGLREMRRVLKPVGRLLVIDVLGEEDPLVDTHLQTLELLRDPSHVRDRSASQWRGLLESAGFTQIQAEAWPLRLEFSSWVARMQTPAARVAVLREVQQSAPREVRDALAFEADGSFTLTTGLFWAR